MSTLRSTPIRPHSLASQVHEEILRRIAAGELTAGSAINIAQVSRETGVSATPVREALARLAAEGQLIFVHNIGYRLPEAPTQQHYVDWAIARIVVETTSLLYILGPIDARKLDEADAINAAIRRTDFGTGAAGIRQFSELNWRFHAKLLELARNPLLDEVHARLYASPQFSRIFLGRGIVNQAKVAAEHQKVIAMLRRGERAAASDALRQHIVDSLQRDARLSHVSISLERLLGEQAGDGARARAASPKPASTRNKPLTKKPPTKKPRTS
ncbi:MAG: GntR family transcriptional regulator [Gammaproteobacteria bacterium]|nr:GntR family transcriptional regulator [Gammaproteobacteria bacterium]MBU2287077.1 GntR family transcriptional regulator [Gammaproteobacteria bacterium]